MIYYEATFRMFKNGEDAERTIGLLYSKEVEYQRKKERLKEDYPESKGYSFMLVGIKTHR